LLSTGLQGKNGAQSAPIWEDFSKGQSQSESRWSLASPTPLKHLKKEFWLSQNSHPGAAGGAPRSVRGAALAGATGRARVGAATNKPSTGS